MEDKIGRAVEWGSDVEAGVQSFCYEAISSRTGKREAMEALPSEMQWKKGGQGLKM